MDGTNETENDNEVKLCFKYKKEKSQKQPEATWSFVFDSLQLIRLDTTF